MDADVKVELENIKRRVSSIEKESNDTTKELWREINKLKDNHGSHDTIIQKLVLSIDHMSKEFTKAIDSLAEALNTHLKEEEMDRKETIKELRSIGWKIFSAVVLTGLVGQLGLKLIGG